MPPQSELRHRRNKRIQLPHRVHVPPEAVAAVQQRLVAAYGGSGNMVPIPDNFQATARCHQPGDDIRHPPSVTREGSPQTDELLRVLGLPHWLTVPFGATRSSPSGPPATFTHVGVSDLPGAAGDGNEVDISDVMDSDTSPDDPAELDIDDLL